MSDTKAAEPSIEDILASIRKIISDDEPESGAAAAPAELPPAPIVAAPEPVAMPVAEEDDDDDILELTEIVVPTEPLVAEAPVEAWPESNDEPMSEAEMPHSLSDNDDEPLASPETVHAASDAFARLTRPEPKPQPLPEPVTSVDGKTVEDLVRELLRPLLREWIDGNLPEMVECLVQKELRKIARRPEDI
jgi:cell pole-organizing protein PopZ